MRCTHAPPWHDRMRHVCAAIFLHFSLHQNEVELAPLSPLLGSQPQFCLLHEGPCGQKTADSLRGRLQGSDSFKVEVRCVSHSYILHLHYIWFLVGKDRTTDPRVGCARSSRAVRERGTPAPAASCCRPEACREGCSGSGLVGDACAHHHPARRNDGVNDDRFAHVARPQEHQASLRHEPGRWTGGGPQACLFYIRIGATTRSQDFFTARTSGGICTVQVVEFTLSTCMSSRMKSVSLGW